jgi:hypothetical protein
MGLGLRYAARYMIDLALPDICEITGRTPEQFKVEVDTDPTDLYGVKVGIKNVLSNTEISRYVYDRHAASFNMSPFNGCCGMCIAFHMTVYNPFRRKGLGTLLETLRIDIATLAGYSKIIATTIDSMEHEHRILNKLGWKKSPADYTNVRTGHRVNPWFYDTDQEMATYANTICSLDYNSQTKSDEIFVGKDFKPLFQPKVKSIVKVEPMVELVAVGPVTISRQVPA